MTYKTGQIVTADDLNADLGPPVGAIMMWPTATAPEGWLICDGSSFSASAYPELNTLLGGTTLPDMRDRAPVGSSGTKVELSTGGAASVTLTTTQLPAHSHGIASFSTLGTANAAGTTPDNGSAAVAQGSPAGRFVKPLSIQAGGTTSTGSGAAFSVQNPYLALHFIIRAS